MSGWGSWLEKGKQLAADLETRIEESVGFEPTSTTEGAVTADLNDAWNEDFDDDDLLEEQVAQSAKPPANDGWNEEEEEEIVMENLQENAAKEELFSSSALQPLGYDAMISSLPVSTEAIESPVSEEVVSFPEKAAVADDQFAPVPEVTEDEAHEDGWDDDLHVDSHDTDEVTESVETVSEKPKEVLWEEDLPATVVEPLFVEDSPVPHVEVFSVPVDEVPTPIEDVPLDEEPVSLPFESTVAPSYQERNEEVLQVIKPAEEPSVKSEAELTQHEYDTNTWSLPEPYVEMPPAEVKHVPNQRQNDESVLQLKEEHQLAMVLLQSRVEDLQTQLRQREYQLTSKAEQLTTIQAMFEAEKDELRKKIADTKEEAKMRIVKAKERVEAMEKRMLDALKSKDEAGAQGEIIAALREEGEKLARKQSEMEKAVRSAKGETRELKGQLVAETAAKEKALEKAAALEADLKSTKEDLTAARKGESQVVKLESELSSAREECDRKASANLSLEQQVKELKDERKELRAEVEQARRGAELETQLESKKLKKAHSDLLSDLETKLQMSDREATLREDALRHEVAELRKRWQDAVRRADALSMDVQQSTAPLLRQLESLERQSRVRAAAWAELETKLRSDLENSVIENEHLVKERNELKSSSNRLQRLMKERDEELNFCKSKIDDNSAKMKQLEAKLASAEAERQTMKEKYEEIEKVANEGVSKVRSDMMQTVVESEERYRAQIETVEKELRAQRDIRSQLERQVGQLLESTGMIQMPAQGEHSNALEEKQMKLRSRQGQAEILASTLTGLDSDNEDGAASEDEEEKSSRAGLSSFAAMEELNQRLRGTSAELSALRQQLAELERTRESLTEELIETRQAREKLPLFETKVKELTEENHEKELEIMGLRDDIAEVGLLYRTQLNALLEEKAAAMSAAMNGQHKESETCNDQPTESGKQQKGA